MTKKYQKCHFFDVLAIGNSNAFGLGDQAIKKSILTDFEILAKKEYQISHLYIQGPKWPKNTGILKSAKIGK